MKKILLTSLITTFLFLLVEKKMLRETLIFLGDKIIPLKYNLFEITDLKKKSILQRKKDVTFVF